MEGSKADGELDLWDEFGDADELECTWCGGEGLCWDAADPISGRCPEEPHNCHACNGSGARKDQVLF